ncbi:DUF6538 domain-containing protein [Cohaesibacter haloalkalitolerans]|uniref:DUF6538 domain-containing protein n=1 Tax=Cohaesibacter haloalkalitolerans TaxID=1162980 RepID=UPI000E65BE27|nr:DUF6538 domain-containing protein [Cohaesibacter haloalkalitolerans]
MGLVLKYVQISSKGNYTYRRAVPKHLQSIIGKREFKKSLGQSEREALKAYPSVHNMFIKQEERAEMKIRGVDPDGSLPRTDLMQHEKIIERIRELGFNPYEVESGIFAEPRD